MLQASIFLNVLWVMRKACLGFRSSSTRLADRCYMQTPDRLDHPFCFSQRNGGNTGHAYPCFLAEPLGHACYNNDEQKQAEVSRAKAWVCDNTVTSWQSKQRGQSGDSLRSRSLTAGLKPGVEEGRRACSLPRDDHTQVRSKRVFAALSRP